MTKKKGKVVKVIDWIDTGIFHGMICFSSGFSYDEIVSLLIKKKANVGRNNQWLQALQANEKLVRSAPNLALSQHVDGCDYLFIIFRETFRFDDWHYVKLAHEILHICQFHLDSYIERTREFEGEAYTHSYIMKKCLATLRGTNK